MNPFKPGRFLLVLASGILLGALGGCAAVPKVHSSDPSEFDRKAARVCTGKLAQPKSTGVKLVAAHDSTIAQAKALLPAGMPTLFPGNLDRLAQHHYLALCYLDLPKTPQTPKGLGIEAILPDYSSTAWVSLK